jgi:site-specific DNA-adenine methylase
MSAPTLLTYPGGKTHVLPTLLPHMERMLSNQDTFHDVFTGGGSVAIQVALRFPEMRICMNERNETAQRN